ncbi:M48 family metalloprotease [Noviherbaspirillum sedimenti]|uniref:M48 family peptidase n=1 Tax=Noviherbaspirillum sedimenti TaxID=2320865 RepID=A0A3A3G7V8_9BURK|nr:M48 family metalloprotease [Noviherbaspirillum sedimenti]RJG04593.1 M48 family peptidase [Noviherbaspirillum sedimenti]
MLSLSCLLPAALAPSLSAAQNLPTLGDSDREELSPVMERRLGEEIMRDVRRDRDYLDDAPVQEYLNNFAATLLSARPDARGEAGYDFLFFAVRDPSLNAFALPGGFIGVHSALVLAAQSESELASVLSHEIGHVAQRHIARMLGRQRQDALLPLAGLILAALAARSSPDASAALLLGGQGMALQRQLNFSREAEREADRIGLQIMKDAGFDTTGMIAFFGRMQNSTRAYTDGVPSFLRSHPLTTERIADIQDRTRGLRYRQRADSLDFHLVRARLRLLQDGSVQGLREAANVFEGQLAQKNRNQTIAGKYGQALLAFRQGDIDRAQALLTEARTALPQGMKSSSMLISLGIELRLAAKQPLDAVREAEAARTQFPLSRGIAHLYADALLAAGRGDDAVRFLRDQTQLYRQEPQLQERLAKAYATQGKQALQHLALAESYALSGSLSSALDQLNIARRAPDASFYDQSLIDAREREWQVRFKEEMKESRSR